MVVFRYLAEKNPAGLYLDGVPLRDLRRADLDRLPAHITAAVAASPFYEAVAPAASDDAAGAVVFTPPAVVEAAERVGRRRPGATKDESAADVVAAPTVDHEE